MEVRIMLKLIEKLFKERAREFLAKDFNKHVRYLKTTIFGKSDYDKRAFDDAVKTCRSDMDKGVDDLYNVLQSAISEFHAKQCEKAQTLAKKVDITDYGHGIIEVGSENNNGTYKVNLLKHECGCQYFKRIGYAGLLCKHYIAAREAFGTIYPIEPAAEDPKPDFRMPKSKDVKSSKGYFVYGSQKLPKRKLTGNSLIPPPTFHVLEGGEPELVIYALRQSESLMLIGDSGTGKSKLIQFLAHETNTPLMEPCGHSEVTVESMLGCYTAQSGTTVWQDGVIPKAMQNGWWLLLEEINAIDPGVLKVLNELLDTRQITITVSGKPKVVKANSDFRLICTTNPPDNPIYRGIEPMSFEMMDRFDTVVYLDYLSPDTEARVVHDRSGYDDEASIKKMVSFANSVRSGMRKGEIFSAITTRGLISWAKKARVFGIKPAAEAALLRKMDSVSRTKALDLLGAFFK
jgi:MoxR-like ATPase